MAHLPLIEAAAYLGMGTTTFRRKVREGRIPKPSKKEATKNLWAKDDLDRTTVRARVYRRKAALSK